MSLYDRARGDAKNILENPDGFSVPALIVSPPPGNIEYGTLDPDDTDNHIRAFIKDHFTQHDPETGIPQAGINVNATFHLQTLLDKGVITDTSEIKLKDYKISWLAPTGGTRRDFKIEFTMPTRTLGHVVFILGELEIE